MYRVEFTLTDFTTVEIHVSEPEPIGALEEALLRLEDEHMISPNEVTSMVLTPQHSR